MNSNEIFDAHKRTCGSRSCGLVATVLSLLTSVTFVGCATPPSKPKASVDSTSQIRRLRTQIRKQNQLIQDLKEKNLVLEKRESNGASIRPELADAETPTQLPGSFDAKELAAAAAVGGESIGGPIAAPILPSKLPAKTAGALSSKPSPKTQSPALSAQAVTELQSPASAALTASAPAPQTPISVSPAKTGEHFLYSKILETYRSRNGDEMQKTLQLLLKTYPESVFADNALYMSGLMAFETGNLSLAQKQFEQLLKEYPRSNKAVSALFAKASIEKRTGRTANAKRGFARVRDLYPGSPEAQRVSTELKLLDAAKSKNREM